MATPMGEASNNIKHDERGYLMNEIERAEEIIQYIIDQGTVETEEGIDVYYVIGSDIEELKAKYLPKNETEDNKNIA